MSLRVELVNRIVAQRVDEKMRVLGNDDVVGRGQRRETLLGWIKPPQGAALIGDEKAPGRIPRCPHRTRHATCQLDCAFSISADEPDDAVRAVGDHDIIAVRQRLTVRVSRRKNGPNAIDPGTRRSVLERPPNRDGVGVRVNGHDPVAALLGDENPVVGLDDHAFRLAQTAGNGLDRAIRIQREHAADVDIAE